MTVRKTENVRATASITTPVEIADQAQVVQAMEKVGQATEEMRTTQPAAELAVQQNDAEAAEVLRALGIEEAMGGLAIEEPEPVSFSMPLHGYSPYYTDSDGEPEFDMNLITNDTFVPAYRGAPWRHSFETYIGHRVAGNYTSGNTMHIVIVRCPPQMVFDLTEIARNHGGVIGNIHRDERDRESVEILKMSTDGQKKFREAVDKHQEKIFKKQVQNKKKEDYRKRVKQLAEKKAATPSTKEAKKQALQARKQEDSAKNDDKKTKQYQKQTRRRK